MYIGLMPKLWNETIEAHRRDVREAILDSAAALLAEHGLRSVTMSRVAQEAGIGRATLYKYFPDVEAVLRACHARQIAGQLERLADVRDRPGSAGEKLAAVLETFALIVHETHAKQGKHDIELVSFLHRDKDVSRTRRQLRDLIRDLLTECAVAGEVRNDVPPDELAAYCLQALTAAGGLPSKAAARRIVMVTLAGLRPPG
jgi:AcrR family transcriptional regulator